MYNLLIILPCRDGGIGRHAILRGWWPKAVRVRFPLSVPNITIKALQFQQVAGLSSKENKIKMLANAFPFHFQKTKYKLPKKLALICA